MLNIKNIKAGIDGTQILNGLNLNIAPGEIHAVMGPNGSGKTTLCKVLAGALQYQIFSGNIFFKNSNLLSQSATQRALNGLFLAFQYPIEIPGVNNIYFLKTALNAKRRAQNLNDLDAVEFLEIVKEKMELLKINEKFLYRNVNEGFSGGEKKRNEILQMSLLEPDLVVLDETDSGLDIDSLKIVTEYINGSRKATRSFLLVTHYQRILEHIVPDYVHVIQNGVVTRSGAKELALELEKFGYDNIS